MSAAKPVHILLVEDEPNLGSVLKDYLQLNQYKVCWEKEGKSGLERFSKEKFDLCILDIMMPVMDGFALGREIRKLDKQVPFIYLTAKVLRDDMVEGFRIGADDYITKPFDAELMLLKIKVILQRCQQAAEPAALPDEIILGKYTFNHKLRQLRSMETEQSLSPRENALLLLLCRYSNSVMPRSEALNTIWGADNYFTTRSMDVFIARLRKYLKEDTSLSIENLHGQGYMLKPPVTAGS